MHWENRREKGDIIYISEEAWSSEEWGSDWGKQDLCATASLRDHPLLLLTRFSAGIYEVYCLNVWISVLISVCIGGFLIVASSRNMKFDVNFVFGERNLSCVYDWIETAWGFEMMFDMIWIIGCVSAWSRCAGRDFEMIFVDSSLGFGWFGFISWVYWKTWWFSSNLSWILTLLYAYLLLIVCTKLIFLLKFGWSFSGQWVISILHFQWIHSFRFCECQLMVIWHSCRFEAHVFI